MTHLQNLLNSPNPVAYWLDKMQPIDKVRLSETLQVNNDWHEVRSVLTVFKYCSTNSIPDETNQLEYE